MKKGNVPIDPMRRLLREPLVHFLLLGALIFSGDRFVDADGGRGHIPYNARTSKVMTALADLKPKLLATMHGSSFNGDCTQALRDLDIVMRNVLTR